MYLERIEKPVKFRNYSTYDLEWVPESLEIRIVGYYDGARYYYFKTIESFLNFVLIPKNNNHWFYAHAGGLYDVQFVLESLVGSEYKVEVSFSGSSAIIVKIISGRHSWFFCDSYWLLRDSLKNIGKQLGMEKTGPADSMDKKDRKEWYRSVSLSVLIPYNENDCVVLYEAIIQFENELNSLGGELQKTIASCAMNLFKRKFLTEKIPIREFNNDIGTQSYFASRVEVFQREGKGYYLDINSSFPYAMTKMLPRNLIAEYDHMPDKLLGKPYFIDCEFTIPDIFLPPLAKRHEGKIYFPVGKWRSYLSWIDFELAVNNGAKINKVYQVSEFEPFWDLAEYATTIYELRRKSTGYKKLVLKYLLNSLYGKFAEGEEKDKVYLNPDFKTIMRLDRDNMLFPGCWFERQEVEIHHRHVVISSAITSWARKTLFDFMSQSDEIHYCDTDGFSSATNNYKTNDKLGGLKLEKIIKIGRFYSPKVYQLDAKVLKKEKWVDKQIYKAKGFSLGNEKEAPINFEKVVSGYDIEVERMSRIRENLRKGITKPWEKIVLKKLQEIKPKRKFFKNGTSRPWDVNEL